MARSHVGRNPINRTPAVDDNYLNMFHNTFILIRKIAELAVSFVIPVATATTATTTDFAIARL